MIAETTHATYNGIMNHLFNVANGYYAMAAEFYMPRMMGFYALARNEAGERWHMGDCIYGYLLKHSKTVNIAATPEPDKNYQGPADAITRAKGWDMATVAAIKKGCDTAMQDDPAALKKMGWLFEYANKELQEIMGIEKAMNIPGASVDGVNAMLWADYKDEISNPCYRK